MLVCAFSWEQRKLGDMMEITSVKRIHQSDWTDSGVRFLRARDIVAVSKNEEVSEPLFISQEKYDEYSALSGKVKIGDLLVTGVGTIGVPMLISSEKPLYFKDGNIIWFKNEDRIDGRFFYHSFNGSYIQNYIKESAGIGTVGTYTIDSGKKTPIILPTQKYEQQKIGAFFSHLDTLITLHQRECFSFDFGSRSAKVAQKTISWEQRKLSDMVERVTRKNENLESELPLTISAQYGLIDQNEFFDKRIASRDVSGYYLLKKGEFAYNKSTSSDAPWGAVKRLDRYEMGVLSTLYIVFALKEDGNIDSDFLVSYYDTDCWHKGVQAIAAEGARNHGLLNITPADYFETVLTVPSNVKEQHQIGTFFAKLDSLITLHQRKCDALQKFKKSMLQKMFPQNGESVPEIRFAGFTDTWEQRKVGELTVESSEYTTLEAGFPLLTSSRNGLMYQNEYRGKQTTDSTETMFSIVPLGACTYRHMSDDDVFHLNVNRLEKGLVSREYPVFYASDDNNLDFIVQQINSSAEFRSFCAEQKKGGTRTRLYYKNLCEFQMLIPNTEEQEKIATFLLTLDTLITLHQRKLETLQKMKKSLLQKMFV